MKTKLTISISVLVIVLIVLALMNNKKATVANVQSPLKIGVVLSQTGAAANWAEFAINAAKLAEEEINKNTGPNDRKIEIVYEDGKTTPNGTISAFQKLTEVDHVNVVVGDLWSFITNPLIPLAESKKVLTISPTVMDKSVSGSSDYFYTLGHTVDSQKASVDKFLEINKSAKTVAIICWNDNWGKAHSELFRAEAASHGLKVVGEECTNDFGSDYKSIVTKVKAMNPDLILMTNATQVPFKVMYELGLRVPALTTTILIDALEIQKMPREYVTNFYIMDWKPNAEFTKLFQAKYGKLPIMEAQNTYESVRSAALALKNNAENPSVGIKSVSYQSVDGNIDFTKGEHINVNKAQAKLYKVTTTGYDEVR